MRSSKRKISAMQSCGTTVKMTPEVFLSNKRKKADVSGCRVLLPDEMIMEVLLRLPVKSILRFWAVCRSWAALLSSKDFCSLHMAIAKAAPAPLKLLVVSPTARFDSTTVYSYSPSGPRDDLLFTLDDARRNSVEVMMPSPCHGLTLLYDAVAPAYYVCNAATQAVTRLPPFCFPACQPTAGLGFDSKTREYKVVRLLNGHSFEKEKVRCEVYTPGGDYGNKWRLAAGGISYSLLQFATVAVINAVVNKIPPVFVNGLLHWLIDPALIIRRPRAAVISFSLEKETFRCIQSPPFWRSVVHTRSRTLGNHLVEMDNQLCMVRDLRKNPYGSSLEIWQLLDYSSGDWSLNHQIDLLGHVARELRDPQLVRVIGSIGNCRSGKKIVIATSEHWVHEKYQKKVHTYDPRDEALETILSTTETHTSLLYDTPGSRFILFEESLARVRKTDGASIVNYPG